MSLNCSEISTYEKMNYELKNVQNVLDVLLKAILKLSNNRFYKNFYYNNRRILIFFHTLFWSFGEKVNIDNTSENIKCGNLKEKSGIYHYEGKRVTI